MKSKEDKKQIEDNEIVEDKKVIYKNGTHSVLESPSAFLSSPLLKKQTNKQTKVCVCL